VALMLCYSVVRGVMLSCHIRVNEAAQRIVLLR
jgi:hypothetical protein